MLKENKPENKEKKTTPGNSGKKKIKIGKLKLEDIVSNTYYLISLGCCQCDKKISVGKLIGKLTGIDVKNMIDRYSESKNKLRCHKCRALVNYYLTIIEAHKNEQKQVRIDRIQNEK